MKLIARIEAYREDLRQRGDFTIIMTVYVWLFILCILLGLIISPFLSISDTNPFEGWASLIVRIGFANFVIYVLARTIIGKKDNEPKSFEERLTELQKEAKAREDFIKATDKLFPKDKEEK
jgi:uncharacterized membrane protein (DUF485 family)